MEWKYGSVGKRQVGSVFAEVHRGAACLELMNGQQGVLVLRDEVDVVDDREKRSAVRLPKAAV